MFTSFILWRPSSPVLLVWQMVSHAFGYKVYYIVLLLPLFPHQNSLRSASIFEQTVFGYPGEDMKYTHAAIDLIRHVLEACESRLCLRPHKSYLFQHFAISPSLHKKVLFDNSTPSKLFSFRLLTSNFSFPIYAISF